ncbi:MAG: helix-turn-helix domain-containing protein [Candidatus Binatia bacterium]
MCQDTAMEQIGARLEARGKDIELDTKDPIVQGGFTQVPNFILKKEALSAGAKVTYAMFLQYAWHNDSCFPGQERLAKDVGAAERSVRTYIQELKTAGLLEVRRRGQGKTNLYTIHFVVNVRRRTTGT